PAFPLPPGITADEYLERLVAQGADERWGTTRDETHKRQLAHELELIRKLGLAGFFLIVWDIVRFARRRGILCQGRGSAANSAVCFSLGITAVDPVKLNLLFERFLSEDRKEAPDIDVDFAHDEEESAEAVIARAFSADAANSDAASGPCSAALRAGRQPKLQADRAEGAPRTDPRPQQLAAAAENGPTWIDPHAKQTHNERRDPTTALRQTQSPS